METLLALSKNANVSELFCLDKSNAAVFDSLAIFLKRESLVCAKTAGKIAHQSLHKATEV